MKTVRLSLIAFILFLSIPVSAWAAGEIKALQKINEYRAENRLGPLTPDTRLEAAARSHAQAMIDQDFFDHTGPNGSSMTDRVTRAGYDWGSVAENLAAGVSGSIAVVKGWIKSRPHRENLILKEAIHAGLVHVYVNPDPGTVRLKHYWVLLVAAPLKAPQPLPEGE